MRPLVCPHEIYPCGAKSPEIEMKLGLSLKLKVNKYFDAPDVCYYHIYANDKPRSVPKYNLKWLQIYVEKMKGMQGWVSASTKIEDSIEFKISEYAYNFTAPISDDMYLILKAEEGSSKGMYDAVIMFSYYEYDPNCVKFTVWNGTDCAPDYNAYCMAQEPEVQALYNPDKNPDV